jgi:hypothetical protein
MQALGVQAGADPVDFPLDGLGACLARVPCVGILQRGGGLDDFGQYGGCNVVVASVIAANKRLKVGVQATEEGEDSTWLCVGLSALSTALS